MAAPKQRPPIPFPSKEAKVSQGATHADPDDLVARCQAGDVDAFETLYRQHAARIYTLACRMADRPRTARTCCRRSSSRPTARSAASSGDAAIGTWLYRLALNHCLDYVRSRQAKMNKLTETLDAEASFEPMARRDTPIARIDLERALERLPEGCREAFVLHDVEGFDHKEVGALLGIAEGTSKSQVFKARAKLRTMLGRN